MAEKTNNDPHSPQLLSAKKKKLGPVKERHSWIQEIDSLYFCKVCTKNPTFLRVLRINNKEEYFVNKGVPKGHDTGRKADVHCKQLNHDQSLDYEKLISGEKRSLIGKMTEQAIVEKSKKESDTNVFVKKYMRAAYWLFKYEIAHTTNFDRLLDLLCLYDEDLCHFSQTRPITAHTVQNLQ